MKLIKPDIKYFKPENNHNDSDSSFTLWEVDLAARTVLQSSFRGDKD